jgi:serine/threonine protein kinase
MWASSPAFRASAGGAIANHRLVSAAPSSKPLDVRRVDLPSIRCCQAQITKRANPLTSSAVIRSIQPMPLSGGQTFAGYRIVRVLGSVGMGEVYLAEHPRLPRPDAIKMLPANISGDPDYRARFNREADLASKLWHPHIVNVHDPGEYNDQLWISMDYVDGLDAG